MTNASSIIAAAESGTDIAALSQVLISFSNAVDERRPAAIAELFTVEGVFRPGDKIIRGRDAIQEFYAERLSDARRRTRHLWSNLQLQPVLPHLVQFSAVLTNYAFEPAVSEQTLQMRLGNVNGTFEQDAGGTWRFAEHLYQRLFSVSLPLT